MAITLDGTTGITTPGLTNTGSTTIVALTTTGNTILGDASTDTLNVGNGNLVTDASGNVGVGVTPSAWATYKAIDVLGYASFSSYNGNEADMSTNAYYNAGWKYKNTAAATLYQQDAGVHRWQYATSGTAGNAITWTQAMTLDASGNMFLGATSASMGTPRFFATGSRANDGVVNFQNTTNTSDVNHGVINIINSATGATGNDARVMFSFRQVGATTGLDPMASMGAVKEAGDMAAALQFNTRSASGSYSEKARIDASGNLCVGNTNTAPGSGNTVTGCTLNGGLGIGYFSRSNDSSLIINTNANGKVSRIYRSGSEVGDITVTTTTTSFNSTSDYRLKTVVGAVSDSGSRIDALEPIEYTWNSTGLRTRGFLAHKFQEVYANSVNGTKDAIDANGNPEYQSMQAGSSEVIADLVAEIQSLRKRLAALESA